MSRFVLDCAVSRPPDAEATGWLAAAAGRAWAPSTGGYHEAKTSQALLLESQRSMASLVRGRSAWFAPDTQRAVDEAVWDLAGGDPGRFTCVITSATDPQVLQDHSALAAHRLGLPHHVSDVDPHGRLIVRRLPQRALLVTAAGNQEIGCLQTDLGDWAAASDSEIVLDASTVFGWADSPGWWRRLILDPRAWGAPPGAVGIVSDRAEGPRHFDNVPAAVTAGLVSQRWHRQSAQQAPRVRAQAAHLRQRILDEVPDVQVYGAGPEDLPHIVSVSVLYVDAEAVQTALDARGYAVGSGSACASRTGQPSHVLAAIGGLTSGNVRIGLPPGLPDQVIDDFVDALREVVHEVRSRMGTLDL